MWTSPPLRSRALSRTVSVSASAHGVCTRRRRLRASGALRAFASSPSFPPSPSPSPSPSFSLPPPLTRREREAFDLHLLSPIASVPGAFSVADHVRVGELVVVVHARRPTLVRVLEVHALNRVIVTCASATSARRHAAPTRLIVSDAAVLLTLGDPWATLEAPDEDALSSELRNLDERARNLARTLTHAQRTTLATTYAEADGQRWFTVEQAAHTLFPALMSPTTDARERVVARVAALLHLLWRWDAFTALPHAVFAPRPRAHAQLWRALRRALNDEPRVARFLAHARGALLRSAHSALWSPVLRTAAAPAPAPTSAVTDSAAASEPNVSDADAQWRVGEDTEARELVLALTHLALGREGGPIFAGEVYARLLRPLGVRDGGVSAASVHMLLRDLGVLDAGAAVPELAEQLNPLVWGPVLAAPPPSSPDTAAAVSAAKVREQGGADPDEHVEEHSELAYAVDSADTTEVDDAVSFSKDAHGHTWLHVHIADPCAVLEPLSSLALEAQRRATTVYLPHTRYAMLPSALHTPLGLDAVPLAPSRALTFSARLDAHGAVADTRVTLARVHVRRVTFTQVEALLAPNAQPAEALAEDAALQRVLQQWQRMAHVRRAYRRAHGAVTAQLPQTLAVQVALGADTGVRVGLVRKATPLASMLVEEAMVVAAEVSARIAQEHALPIAFRAQTPPEHVPTPLTKDELAPGTSEAHTTLVNALRLFAHMPSATLQATPARHHSLALDVYARATSPLRRYADLVTHWQLRALLTRGRTRAPFTGAELAALLPRIHYTSKRAQQLQRSAERYWKLRWVAHATRARGEGGEGNVVPPVFRAVVFAATEPITLREALERDASALALGVDLVSGAEVALRVRHIRYYVLELELQGTLIAPLERVRGVRVGELLGLRARVRDEALQFVTFDLAPLPEDVDSV